MTLSLKKYYFQLLIKLLIIFKPAVLFDKINQLNWYKNALREWVDHQEFTAKSRVLEVGCATGALTAHIAKSGHIPTGVDFSNNMVELAKNNNSDINFLVADALDLPFEENYFDHVIAASLINIITDKKKAIDSLYRVCKKGGKITILVPSNEFNDIDCQTLQASIEGTGFSIAAMEAWHKRAPKMNPDDIEHLFKQAGLIEFSTKNYLQGMVISATGTKPFSFQQL